MNKMTGLEAMRWARENRERQSLDPWISRCSTLENLLFAANVANKTLTDKVEVLNTTLTSDFAKHVFERMKIDIADLYRDQVDKALCSTGVITMSVDAGHLRFFERPTDELLSELAQRMKKSLKTTATVDPDGTQHLRITAESVSVQSVVKEGPRS